MLSAKRLLGSLEDIPQDRATPRESFDEARALAAQMRSRQVVVVRQDLSLLELACPDQDSMPRDVLQQVQKIVPPSVKRNIAVIASTDFAVGVARAGVGTPGWTAAGDAIPFFALLNGLGCIGHTVWIFDPDADMTIACRDADILLVDSAVAGSVPEASLEAARKVMRASFILMHDRESAQLRPFGAR